jgi:hypothetical protein
MSALNEFVLQYNRNRCMIYNKKNESIYETEQSDFSYEYVINNSLNHKWYNTMIPRRTIEVRETTEKN